MVKENAPFNPVQKLEFNENGIIVEEQNGLTILGYIATQAMVGLLTRVPNRDGGETDLGVLESKRIAEESVIMAKELIKALNKKD